VSVNLNASCSLPHIAPLPYYRKSSTQCGRWCAYDDDEEKRGWKKEREWGSESIKGQSSYTLCQWALAKWFSCLQSIRMRVSVNKQWRKWVSCYWISEWDVSKVSSDDFLMETNPPLQFTSAIEHRRRRRCCCCCWWGEANFLILWWPSEENENKKLRHKQQSDINW
jgi:hypothetical protein